MSADTRYLRVLVAVALVLAGLAQLPAADAVAVPMAPAAAPVTPVASYYVDPVKGVNGELPQYGTSPDSPWKTVKWAAEKIRKAHPVSQAGVELNLRAGVLHNSSVFDTLKGTPERPFVVQPYGGDTMTFDGSEPQLREPGAWTKVAGVDNEWVSEPLGTLANQRIALGRMTDTRELLIAYSELQDLRATNQSFAVTPLSDPRPAFGRARDGNGTLTETKVPFLYLGPGTYFEWLNTFHTQGRVHLRLAPTRLKAPGIRDYPGGTDPTRVAVANNTGYAANFGAVENAVVRNAVFQNGGNTTLGIGADVRNVTFDRCQVYGTRIGARVNGQDIHFENCTFDGGLAPWTTRSDVKDTYDYEDVPGCTRNKSGFCTNGLGAHSHDILVDSNGDRISYVGCTFRRAHDAIQLGGRDPVIRRSLFEDLNDEVVQFEDVLANAQLSENVFRQVMHPFSFEVLEKVSPGPIYFFRNVVDQRVPARGYRTLVPDAPEPYIWRHGADLKSPGNPVPDMHVYQNTFISSHGEDRTSYVNQLFSGMLPDSKARTYHNNVHLVLNLDLALEQVPDLPQAAAAGNIWYRFHPNREPVFRAPMFQRGSTTYQTLADLHRDVPAWEADSQYVDPQLTNFSDEYFDHQVEYPNTDYRPAAGGPADGTGVVLDPSWPDPFRPADGSRPDVGARPVDAPVLTAGVDGLATFPVAGTPIAAAGPDQDVADPDGEGFAPVALAGAATGAVTAWTWTEKDKIVATTPNPTLTLPEGEHSLRLSVLDAAGRTDSDAVRVRIVGPAPGANRLACAGFEPRVGPCPWQVTGPGAVLDDAQFAHSGSHAFRMVANGTVQQVRQRVGVNEGATYAVSGWLRTQGPIAATLTAQLLDETGSKLGDPIIVGRQSGNSPYANRQVTIVALKGAVWIELVTEVPAQPVGGTLYLDDLRVRDHNLLRNGDFEQDVPTGPYMGQQGYNPPEWTVRGTELLDDPALAHDGQRTLALVPGAGGHLIEQRIAHAAGTRYLVSAWIRTEGVTTAPLLKVAYYKTSGSPLTAPVASIVSEGSYTFVKVDLATVPAGTVAIGLILQYVGTVAGKVYLDDALIEPVP
jgi:hypothetical protein